MPKRKSHKNDLNRISAMKNALVKRKRTLFTRQDFMNTTKSSRYFFYRCLDSGFIVDTGNVFNTQGAPIAYALAKAFSSHAIDRYSLNEEDIKILLRAKETKLIKLNGSVKMMQSQISKIKDETALLKLIKL